MINIFITLIVVIVSQVNIDFKLSNYTRSIRAVKINTYTLKNICSLFYVNYASIKLII